ncbi:clathrin light chain B-like isoform X2 [Tubulanus polymorphus]|uniref:clathrin light chain B-like isoform X2 n=1 Tax=Tubulanus polymorphus TaxID=672921 RepID=UPI003DA1D8C9
MAEFDNFESGAAGETTEEDPAAAFLAREQDQLAGLEDDGFGGTNFQAEPADDGFEPAGTGQFAYGRTTSTEEYDEQGFDYLNTDGQSNGPSDQYSAISQVDQLRQEPEKIKRWREEQKERLEKKDEEAEEKKEAWRVVAKKELEDWYKNREEQLQKVKDTNRENEVAFVQERDESIPGHEWERVCRLTDFNPKNSKNSKDVSRLRSILLQLKQTPLVR